MVGLVREGKPEQTDQKTPACLIKQIAIQQPFPFSTGKKKKYGGQQQAEAKKPKHWLWLSDNVMPTKSQRSFFLAYFTLSCILSHFLSYSF